MDINLLKGFICGKPYEQSEKYDLQLEEKIISVIWCLHSEIEELKQHAQNNDLSKECLREKVRIIEIKVKHLKRLAG